MNAKTVTVILVLVCLALTGGLFYRHNKASQEKKKDTATIADLSNHWSEASAKLEEQKLVNLTLERDLVNQTEAIKSLSNNLASTTANLSNTQVQVKTAQENLKTTNAELEKRNARIAELEGERDELTKRMATLNTSITDLEAKMVDTQRRLDASEGDREFLLKELKRLQAEKAELERQFNDLALLREQVRRMRDELSINRRLDWIRRGLYGNIMKGGERLQKGFTQAPVKTNYNLNVELNRDGSIRVLSALTNAPAAPNPATPTPAPAAK